MKEQIRSELHRLVDSCDNELLLEEAKALLASNQVKDWWDELTPQDQHLLLESESEYHKGNVITHNDLMDEFRKWKEK